MSDINDASARFKQMEPTDYVRCRPCDQTRIAAWRRDDICVPFNKPADLLCPCGALREAYNCQGQRFDEDDSYPPIATGGKT